MKYLSILRYVLIAVSVGVIAHGLFGGSEIIADYMLQWAYVLIGLTVVLAVLMPAINFAKNPKGAVRSLIGMVIVAVVLGVAYSLSDGTTIVTATGDVYDNVLELKLSDTGLFTTYFAFGATLVSILAMEVYNMFK